MKKIIIILFQILLISTLVSCKTNKVTVTFDSNGGSLVEKQIIEEGKFVVKPADPIKDGETFSGWYFDNDGNNEVVFPYYPTKNETLYASWGIVSGLVISKVYTASSMDNNCIEIYNPTSNNINLSQYSIRFYQNGSTTVMKDYTVNLSGTLSSESSFLISTNSATVESINQKSDFKIDNYLPFNGNDAIGLFKSNKLLDAVGFIGQDVDFSKNLTLIRVGEPNDFQPSNIYTSTKFISYVPECFEYLKNFDYEIKTIEDILKGPRLEDKYLTMPYVETGSTTIGGGGAETATLGGIADGDTATFSFPSRTIIGGSSMRYYYLNTPEVNGGTVVHQPWGYVASKYNKEYLLNNASSKLLQVQSLKGVQTTEGYGRCLGLVWINGYLSQFLIAAEGLSVVSGNYGTADIAMNYKNIPYLTFLRFAESNAIEHGWGVHGYPTKTDGEKSPDWNYVTNKTATQSPVWVPHNKLPWQ